MKKIPHPDLASATKLKPAELNKIHFAGNRSPLTPEQLEELAAHARDEKNPAQGASSGKV